ncbi:unnamed protein product [Dibothriocephalus latus]|uniref:Uncharacterized protein n=1 Tax=Dibothriocephalus latus TaxID=60516 RepID=A0A3P6QQZ7_DIBLA|nr:unnamed protein product [Dibothriocephalus latus]
MVDGDYATRPQGILKIVGAILGFTTMIVIVTTLPLKEIDAPPFNVTEPLYAVAPETRACGVLLFVPIYVWVVCLTLLLLRISEGGGMDIFVRRCFMFFDVSIKSIFYASFFSYLNANRDFA